MLKKEIFYVNKWQSTILTNNNCMVFMKQQYFKLRVISSAKNFEEINE